MAEAKGVHVDVKPGSKHWQIYGKLGGTTRRLGIIPNNDAGGADRPGRGAANFRAGLKRALIELQRLSKAQAHA